MPRFNLSGNKPKYKTTQADFDIFKLGREDVNWISDYYLRSPTSGTYWKRVPNDPDDQDKVNAWLMMYSQWAKDGKPDEVWPYSGIIYRILQDEGGDPIFWHNHGWLFQGWQRVVHHAPQPDITVISGFGVGKTALMAATLAVTAMIMPNFRGYAIAPQMLQTMEVYNYIQTNFKETLWYERFVHKDIVKPNPYIELQASHLGTSSQITMLSVETDPEKVRTLEGDVILLDQAEKFDDLESLTVDIGSRLRGTVMGRPRMGRLAYFANSNDNPALWQRFDMGELDPENYLSLRPSSRRDNIYLSKKDIRNYFRRFGVTESAAGQYLDGDRPAGKGDWFNTAMVDKNTNPDLLPFIREQAALEREKEPGKADFQYKWQYEETPEAKCFHYEMPTDHKSGRQYMVIGDPGSFNPPNRNSAVIGAWDITDFPVKPCRLVGFHWVYGNGFYDPFLASYTNMVKKYRAQGRNGFDSTGVQKGFDEMYFATHKIAAMGLNMAGTGKNFSLVAAKFIMGSGMLEIPEHIHIRNQLTSYVLPDTKLRQDITMMIAMSCWYLKMYFYVDIPDDEEDAVTIPVDPSYYRNQRTSMSRNRRRA